RGGRVRSVRPSGHEAALALALTEPVTNALAGARLRELGRSAALGQEFSLVGEEQRPGGLLWHGVNLAPLSATDRALEELGRHQASRQRRSSSVVGDRRAVEILWGSLAELWGADVRAYRWSQPLLLADDPAGPPRLAPAGRRAADPGEEAAGPPGAVARTWSSRTARCSSRPTSAPCSARSSRSTGSGCARTAEAADWAGRPWRSWCSWRAATTPRRSPSTSTTSTSPRAAPTPPPASARSASSPRSCSERPAHRGRCAVRTNCRARRSGSSRSRYPCPSAIISSGHGCQAEYGDSSKESSTRPASSSAVRISPTEWFHWWFTPFSNAG